MRAEYKFGKKKKKKTTKTNVLMGETLRERRQWEDVGDVEDRTANMSRIVAQYLTTVVLRDPHAVGSDTVDSLL